MSEESTGPSFSRRVDRYAENADLQLYFAKWLGEWIETGLSESVRMWELGSGTGFFTRELIRRGYRILATDIAPDMVARGRHDCPEADWAIHDSWRLPEKVSDRLYSSSLLQWMPNPEKTLRVFYNALRPGGKMLHGFFVAPSLQELYSVVPVHYSPVLWRSEEEWLSVFEQTGFKVLRSDAVSVRGAYPSAMAFLKKLKDVGPGTIEKSVSSGELRRILREYDDRFPCENGGVYASWRFLRVELARV